MAGRFITEECIGVLLVSKDPEKPV